VSEKARSEHLRLIRHGEDAPDLPLSEDDEHKELALQDDAGQVESAVVEGEIVSDSPEQSRRLPSLVVDGITVLRPYARSQVVRVAKRESITILQGWHSWWMRAWWGLTLGRHRKQIRIADETGDREALAYWMDLKDQAADRRRERLMRLPLLGLRMAALAGGSLIGGLVLLFLISTLVWATGAGGWTDTWVWVGGVLRWLFRALAFLWMPFVISLPFWLVWAGRREGQRKSSTQRYTAKVSETPNGERRNVFPDESAIVTALQHLGISELNKAFKAGWRPRIVTPTHRDGKGWRTQLEPPYGVTVAMIVDKKPVLAHNLARFPIEVWPTEPKAGVLDLWVANPGSLTGPLPPWPLLKDGAADYFKGVPVAMNIRGETISGLLFEANYAIGGRMGSGKSTLIITLLLGALLDPLVIADVFVMAVNSDYDPMRPRLRTLMTGTGEDVVEKCMNTLRDAYAELDVRGKALQEHGVRANSRELAEKDQRLRPRIIVIDECQALFMHAEYGDEAIAIATKLQFAARKYGVTLIYATPEPTADSLPRKLVSMSSNQACFAIGDQIGNDAVLGTGSYKAGISAVGLKPKTRESLGDVGTCVARNFEETPGLLRCYYVGVADAKAVVERALQIREKAGVSASAALSAAPVRDLLDDLDEVLGTERLKVADVPALLRKLAPGWPGYQGMTGIQLKDLLTLKHGVKVPNHHNVFHVDPDEVRRVRALRGACESDEGRREEPPNGPEETAG
jgi:S-DNA-T family DNA segregation ATPase FtsK/SpoIIIE